MCINENIFKFNELGLLPPGCHEVTLMDIKTFFVDNVCLLQKDAIKI
ncbi:unknown [Methanobrevibacter smithii CAG:186]|uniref:Uncharacterized protein n=1 Tax=Methanobrevibacter smithii CAG:186 TaxID=1263088 RepID=R7PU12_METSM|nr:hypothetical protein [Methanobrevibacter smithii]CDF28604.1 unknown [Methanobrevibacter smithii CAG:186]